jgi:hypothetical protein
VQAGHITIDDAMAVTDMLQNTAKMIERATVALQHQVQGDYIFHESDTIQFAQVYSQLFFTVAFEGAAHIGCTHEKIRRVFNTAITLFRVLQKLIEDDGVFRQVFDLCI